MSVKSTYFNKEKKEIFSKTIGVPISLINEACLITDVSKEDSGEHLISLHYNPDKIDLLLENPGKYSYHDIVVLSTIRGVIWDVDSNKVIVRSYPKTSCLPVLFVPHDRMLEIPTAIGLCSPTRGKYKKRYPGALIRAYMYKGDVRLSTHKKMNANSSFFGDSDKFTDIFMRNQTVFQTLGELYTNCDDSIIHLFILNDRKLCVDSRDKHSVDKIVYLRSFSVNDPTRYFDLTEFILERNTKTDKPIEICQEYTVDEVNRVLSGRIPIQSEDVDDPSMINNIDKNTLSVFSAGEMVIYEHEFGINTLVPQSCAWRQKIMDGKINIRKLYIDSVGDLENNSRNYINIAFSPTDLFEIAKKIEDEEEIDLSKYRQVIGNSFLMILTNLIFVVPINRLNECFQVYEEFDADILIAIEYMIERKSDIKEAINDGKLSSFDAMSSGVKFRDYVNKKMGDPIQSITGTKDNWVQCVKDLYSEYYKISQESCESDVIRSSRENMGIISLISNAKDDLLYSFVTYKNKVEKERAAFLKRSLISSA